MIRVTFAFEMVWDCICFTQKKKKKACLGPLLQGPKHLIGKKVKPGSLSSKVAINL